MTYICAPIFVTIPRDNGISVDFQPTGGVEVAIPSGPKGLDGVSPEVTISNITGGHAVTITDADHPNGQTFNVMDGSGAVHSVNSKTGNVVLDAGDISYDSSGNYSAGTVGGALNDVKSAVQDGLPIGSIVSNSYINNATGAFTSYNGRNRTDYIYIGNVGSFSVTKTASSQYNAYYDKNKTFLSAFTTPSGTSVFFVPPKAVYMALSDSASNMTNTSIALVKSAVAFKESEEESKNSKRDAFTGYSDLKGTDWGVGFINNSGVFVDAAGLSNNNGKRIVQRSIHYADKNIICDIANGYRYAVQFFASLTPAAPTSVTSWQTGGFTIPAGSYYIIGQVGETTDTTTITNYLENGLYNALSVRYADNSNVITIPERFGITKKIVCWGNSLTQGATNSYSNPWPTQLKALLGDEYTVINHGISGEGVQTIGGRQGGITMLTGNPFTIPADRSGVEVTLTNMLGGSPTPLQSQDTALATANVNNCSIAGIIGTLSYSNSKYYFARNVSGNAKTVDRPTPIITHAMMQTADGYEPMDIMIIWTGENGEFDTDYEKLVAYTGLIVKYQKNPNYLIISKSNNSYTGTFGTNYTNAMIREHGRKFINIVEYLCLYGLDDLDISPTEDDTTAMGNGLIPPSLKTDSTHLTTAAYGIVSRLVYERGKELGYWN